MHRKIRIIPESLGAVGNVEGQRLGAGFAHIQRLDLSEDGGLPLYQVRQPVEQDRPVVGRQRGPAAVLEGRPGGPDRPVDVRFVAGGHRGKDPAFARIEGFEGLFALGLGPLPADEHLEGLGREKPAHFREEILHGDLGLMMQQAR